MSLLFIESDLKKFNTELILADEKVDDDVFRPNAVLNQLISTYSDASG